MTDNVRYSRLPENIQNLSIGQLVKSYKIMCSILNQEIKAGDSKKSQEKEWKRFFNFEKEGYKYIITEIYLTPLPKEDKRINGNNSEYIEHIQLLLFNHLMKQDGFITYLSLKDSFQLLGFVNFRYFEKDITEILKLENIKKSDINHFYQRTYSKFKKTLFDSLTNLKHRNLIDFKEEVMVKVDNFSLHNIQNTDVRLANDEEINLIKDTKREVLLSMGLESILQVHLKFLNDKFYTELNKLLYERYAIHYTYTRVKIYFTHKYIEGALEQSEIRLQREMINKKLINSLNEQVENNIKKNHKEYDEAVDKLIAKCIGNPCPSDIKKFYRIDEDVYRYTQEQLTDYLLDIKL